MNDDSRAVFCGGEVDNCSNDVICTKKMYQEIQPSSIPVLLDRVTHTHSHQSYLVDEGGFWRRARRHAGLVQAESPAGGRQDGSLVKEI